MAAAMGPWDIAVMAVLFGLTVMKGIWITWRGSRGYGSSSWTPEGFFLAGRDMPWWAIGLSLFASNIGAEHFVGQAGEAAKNGMAVSIYEWTSGFLLFLLGFGLAPMYLGINLRTTPEWFERRFNSSCRLLLAVVSILAYAISKISATLFAGAVLFDVMIGLSMWVSVPAVLLFTAAYAVSGGLSAVMYTDVAQATIFVAGGAAGMALALSEVGGFEGLRETLSANGLGYFMGTLRPIDDPDYPWTGMMLGQTLASVWYWCIDQVLVQRVLAAKDLGHAQGGCTLAGFLKILPPFLMVVPGMIARCFFEECRRSGGLLRPEWCGTDLDTGAGSNSAYPLLIAKTFPDGLRGLMVVSMVLAMMSSLDSVFNSASVLFTSDIYLRFLAPSASPRRQVWVGRLFMVAVACLSLAWLPMIASSSSSVYLFTQGAISHMSPTLVAVFLIGLLWTRANGPGGFAGMAGGFLLGLVRFVINQRSTCDAGSLGTFACMNFNHMAVILFASASFVTVVVSLLTPPPSAEKLREAGVAGCAEEEDGGGQRACAAGEVAAVEAEKEEVGRTAADFLRIDPVRRRLLLCIGLLLVATVMALSLGFGYSSPVDGGEPAVPLGIVLGLSTLCVLLLAGAGMARVLGSKRGGKRSGAEVAAGPAGCQAGADIPAGDMAAGPSPSGEALPAQPDSL